MSRWNLLILILLCPVAWSGCSMCCGPFDYEYPMMDNAQYQRLDPEYGRVGSILSDPNVPMGPAPLTNADLPEEPLPDEEEEEIEPLNLEGEESGGDRPSLDEETDPFTGRDNETSRFYRQPGWK